MPDGVQQILSNGMSVADRPSQSAPSVRPQASVIVDCASARSRGCAVKAVAALGATDQALHDALGATVRRGECFLLDWRRSSASANISSLTRAARVFRSIPNAATRGWRCFAKLRRHATVSAELLACAVRSASCRNKPLPCRQDCATSPEPSNAPSAPFFARWGPPFVEHTGDSADAVTLNRVKFVDPTNNQRLLFDNLIIGRTMLALAHIAITERRARKHVHLTLTSTMSFPAS